jgi:hypothetical protein
MDRFFITEDSQWAFSVKVRAGWVCQECGELDRELLEAHHIKPKAKYPALANDPHNGKCLCLWCHALAHKDRPGIVRRILARLGFLLYRKFYGSQFRRTIGKWQNGQDVPDKRLSNRRSEEPDAIRVGEAGPGKEPCQTPQKDTKGAAPTCQKDLKNADETVVE